MGVLSLLSSDPGSLFFLNSLGVLAGIGMQMSGLRYIRPCDWKNGFVGVSEAIQLEA